MSVGPDGDEVPQMFLQPAFAAGAVPADSDAKAFVSLPEAIPGKTHSDLIQDGIKVMIGRDEEGDFTASGLPDRRKLAGLVGLNVTAEALALAWKTLNEPQ